MGRSREHEPLAGPVGHGRAKIRLVAAFAHAVRTRLRDERHDDAERLMEMESREALTRWSEAGSSVPLFVLQTLGARFSKWREVGQLSELTWQPLEQGVILMTDILGASSAFRTRQYPFHTPS